jgi:hypothetical protein
MRQFGDREFIIKPNSQSDNLCMFYAMLNGLQHVEERMAFCGGNVDQPAQLFESLLKYWTGPLKKDGEGKDIVLDRVIVHITN